MLSHFSYLKLQLRCFFNPSTRFHILVSDSNNNDEHASVFVLLNIEAFTAVFQVRHFGALVFKLLC